MKKNQYIISNELSIEEERLDLLNAAYSPKTKEVLSKYLVPDSSVLEIGMGAGHMAQWLSEQINDQGLYMGVDRSPDQIKRASAKLPKENNSIIIIQDDIFSLNENQHFLKNKPEKGFDVIYMRWVLCHIPIEEKAAFVQLILSWLAPGGVFICEDTDYKELSLAISGHKVDHWAIDAWKAMVRTFKEKKILDVEYSSERMLKDFNSYIKDKSLYTATIIDSFQAELTGRQKYSMVYGLEVVKKIAVEQAVIDEKTINDMVEAFKEIADNSEASVYFYRNVFGAISKSKG